jgi:hypothetical protein
MANYRRIVTYRSYSAMDQIAWGNYAVRACSSIWLIIILKIRHSNLPINFMCTSSSEWPRITDLRQVLMSQGQTSLKSDIVIIVSATFECATAGPPLHSNLWVRFKVGMMRIWASCTDGYSCCGFLKGTVDEVGRQKASVRGRTYCLVMRHRAIQYLQRALRVGYVETGSAFQCGTEVRERFCWGKRLVDTLNFSW